MVAARPGWVALAAGGALTAAVIAAAVSTGEDDASRGPTTAPAGGSGPAAQANSSGHEVAPFRSGYNYALNDIVNPSQQGGGTLRLLAAGDCDSWDPARVTFGWCVNLQRLITRTLVGYAKVDGPEFELGADLATSLGRHNADYTQWTYTLRPGLRYANGKPIRPIDVKYGIERLFDPDVRILGGSKSYLIDSIAHPNSYRGPHRSGDLSSITTTGDSITFRLTGPNAEFDYLMALPASAPVPGGRRSIASGPFEIRSYTPKTSILLGRNPQWRQGTDPIRHPLVHTVRLSIERPNRIDQDLRAGRADARADGGVQDGFADEILHDRRLMQNADDPILPATRYMAVTPDVVPNIHCRRAMFYAWSKAAALRVFGGPTSGLPATAMTPPDIEGYDPSYDPYPVGAALTGDVAKARAELRLCGKPNGFTTRFMYDPRRPGGRRLFTAERRALGRVGIRVRLRQFPLHGSYIFTGSPAQLKDLGIGLLLTSRAPDFPTDYGFYQPIIPPESHVPSAPVAAPSLDPARRDLQRGLRTGEFSEAEWAQVNRDVMSVAEYLPFLWEKALYYRNPRMTNVTCDIALASGIYDFVNIGVR